MVLFFCFHRLLFTFLSTLRDFYILVRYGAHANNRCFISGPIISRSKCFPLDLARESDFVTWPFWSAADPSELLSPSWTPYSMDAKWLCLLEGKSTAELQARMYPFMYIGQFDTARRVARISLASLFSLCEDIRLQCNLVYVGNVPRAGTTLLSAMLQGGDNLISLGEPDVLMHLAHLKNSGLLDSDSAERTMSAVVKLLGHNLPAGATLTIKPRNTATWLCEDVKRAFGDQAKLLFCTRRNLHKAFASIIRMIGSASDNVFMQGLINNPGIFAPVIGYFVGLAQIMLNNEKRVDIQKVLLEEFNKASIASMPHHRLLAFAMFIDSYSPYYIAKSHDFEFFNAYYEDFSSDDTAETTLRQLFSYCNMSEEHLHESLKALHLDSQGGTDLSQENTKQFSGAPLLPEEICAFNNACARLNLPALL